MMRLGAFLFPIAPARIAEVIDPLLVQGFLHDAPSADMEQLAAAPAHPLVDALRSNPKPSPAELSEILARASSSPSEPGVVHLYSRLVAPARLPLPLREAAEAALGELRDETDPRAPFDPLEIVLPLLLDDPEGTLRAKLWRRSRAFAASGPLEGVQILRPARHPDEPDLPFEALAELRVLEETCPYFAHALRQSGVLAAGAVYLSSLDD